MKEKQIAKSSSIGYVILNRRRGSVGYICDNQTGVTGYHYIFPSIDSAQAECNQMNRMFEEGYKVYKVRLKIV